MAQMPEQTNPIERLHDTLTKVLEFGQTQARPDALAQDVWIRTFGLNQVRLLVNLHDIVSIVKLCEQSVRRGSTVNQELHLEQIEKMKVGLGLIAIRSGTWQQFQLTFNDDFMNVLLMMSENISIHGGEEVIPEEELASLQSDVEDIINKVVDSGLDTDIKSVLFEGLEAVRDALLNYQIYGAEGIRNAVDKNVGSYARHKEVFDRASQTECREVIDAYRELINEVNVTLSKALKFKPLVKPVARILPMLGIGSDGCI